MQKAGTGKSPGAGGIPIELWKALGDEGVKWLTWFLNRIVKEMKMPNKWRESKIIPIFKRKGDASECGNYRGIKLLAHTFKLYEKILERRLCQIIKINEAQFGFMPQMSTTVRQVIADTVEKEDKMVAVFIDLEKAYDSIPRNQIWSALRRRKIPEYMVNLIENTYAKNKTTVKTSAGTTNSFKIQGYIKDPH